MTTLHNKDYVKTRKGEFGVIVCLDAVKSNEEREPVFTLLIDGIRKTVAYKDIEIKVTTKEWDEQAELERTVKMRDRELSKR